MTTTSEKYEFKAEARQVLDLMIHSVYSHKEIFLRELISNASDALDKLHFAALTDPSLSSFTSDPHIRLAVDPGDRTLFVTDNGIGMNRAEVVDYIGTIARSGTREFLQALQTAKKAEMTASLIGQFGVGFYSSFMVADRVSLVTRRAGENQAWRWESTGDGSYTLEETTRETPGTSVILHLKPADKDAGLEDFTQEWVLRETVKRYSDFVSYPIRMKGKEKDQEKDQALNSRKAIWTRPEKEVAPAEYKEFYKHLSHDWNEPLKWLVCKAEGTSEFRALLYLPSRAPFDLFPRERKRGIHLYIKRVFILSDCEELVPEYLRFVQGVIDSEDLPLNLSREILQHNRQAAVIRKTVVRKVLSALKEMKEKEPELYLSFWYQFGRVVKEGLFQDQENRDPLFELCLFASTISADKLATVEDYLGRMKPGQETIYYLNGESRAVIEHSPHLEALKEKGYEVLLLSDPVDEVWVRSVFEHKGKKFVSAERGEFPSASGEDKKKQDEERKEKEKNYAGLFASLQKKLDEQVKEIRLSTRLTSSPACLSDEEGALGWQFEQMLRSSGQEVPKSKRILELNPAHPLLARLQSAWETNHDDPRLGEAAELLFGQAVLAGGGKLPDPAGFSRKVADLMMKAW